MKCSAGSYDKMRMTGEQRIMDISENKYVFAYRKQQNH